MFPQVASHNPFVTRELLELRWTQRRRLRCVPDRFLAAKVKEWVVPDLQFDVRPLAELALRNRAIEVVVGDPAAMQYLELCERAGRGQVRRSGQKVNCVQMDRSRIAEIRVGAEEADPAARPAENGANIAF